MFRFFFGFCRKLTGTDKVREHNRCTVFSRGFVFLKRALTGVVSTLYYFYPLFVLLPHSLRQLPFSPPPLSEYPATDRVRLPLGLGGYAKSYDHVAPWLPSEGDTMIMMYPAAADLSTNHRASRDASIISPRRLLQRPPLTLEIIFQASTMSGIKNVVYSLLLLFTSSFVPMLLRTAFELGP